MYIASLERSGFYLTFDDKTPPSEGINGGILARLNDFPVLIRELAVIAVRLAQSLPAQTVADQMEDYLRQAVSKEEPEG